MTYRVVTITMSGILSTTVAPNASIVAQTNQHTPQRGDANSPATAVNAQQVVNGQPAVVSLSVETRNRAASHGDHKEVDPSFEKQEIKESKKQPNHEHRGRTVDVEA